MPPSPSQSSDSQAGNWHPEIIGFVLFFIALIFMLALFGLTSSPILDNSIMWIRRLVGYGVFPLTLLLGIGGIWLMFRQVLQHAQSNFVPTTAVLITLILPLVHWITRSNYATAMSGRGGGLIGWTIASLFSVWWGWILAIALYIVIAAILIVMFAGGQGQLIVRWLVNWAGKLHTWADRLVDDPFFDEDEYDAFADDNDLVMGEARPITVNHLPPLTLLDPSQDDAVNHIDIDQSIEIIEETLIDFGLIGKIINVRQGPTVTQFGVEPGYLERSDGTHKKIRIAQIANLRQDFALALAVPRLRIEAPVPGKGIVGIEVPNPEATLVRLRDALESAEFNELNKPLGVPLGHDVAGRTVAIDLAKMPHLLIAGTTGAGKSICMKAIVTALVANNTPEQLRLVMIDPKRVEMARFNQLPHMYGPAEVDGDRIIAVLRWVVAEMEHRYAIFAQASARQLSSYNGTMRAQGAPIMPYIVVMIDELADLMAQFSAETERTLCRLAQMARATGIHLVVATQRPSTDVITGLIKANFPARIAFSVASSIDSRVVLDTSGAEQLLGNGDMLFLGSDASTPRRVQGCFVTDEEIDRLVTWWQEIQDEDDEPQQPPWTDLLAKLKIIEETDDELERAIALCQKYDTLSTSLLQRRLRVGYPRAARIMENLYEMGLVEDPKRGGKTRKTFVSDEDGDVFGQIAEDRYENDET